MVQSVEHATESERHPRIEAAVYDDLISTLQRDLAFPERGSEEIPPITGLELSYSPDQIDATGLNLQGVESVELGYNPATEIVTASIVRRKNIVAESHVSYHVSLTVPVMIKVENIVTSPHTDEIAQGLDKERLSLQGDLRKAELEVKAKLYAVKSHSFPLPATELRCSGDSAFEEVVADSERLLSSNDQAVKDLMAEYEKEGMTDEKYDELLQVQAEDTRELLSYADEFSPDPPQSYGDYEISILESFREISGELEDAWIHLERLGKQLAEVEGQLYEVRNHQIDLRFALRYRFKTNKVNELADVSDQTEEVKKLIRMLQSLQALQGD